MTLKKFKFDENSTKIEKSKTYFCNSCQENHEIDSAIGKKHANKIKNKMKPKLESKEFRAGYMKEKLEDTVNER